MSCVAGVVGALAASVAAAGYNAYQQNKQGKQASSARADKLNSKSSHSNSKSRISIAPTARRRTWARLCLILRSAQPRPVSLARTASSLTQRSWVVGRTCSGVNSWNAST